MVAMDREAAEWLAAEELLRRGIYTLPDGDVVVVAEVEHLRSTWVVYYNSKRYLDTGDVSFALAGNGPVLVAPDYRCEIAESGIEVLDAVLAFEKRADPA
jgi:hypothetical protein